MMIIALLFVGVGLALLYRGAAAVAGGAVAVIALVAFAAGQLLLVRPTLPEALALAGAALALEVSRALRASWPKTALGVLAIPALLIALTRPGVPTPDLVVDVLFCSQHGALATSAVLWLGVAGLVWGAIRDPKRAGPAAASFAVIAAAIAGSHEPASTWRDAVGAFSPAWPVAALGLIWLTAHLSAVAASRPAWAAALLMAPLVLWNVTLIAVAHAGILRIGEAVSFGTIGAAQARTLHGWIGHVLSAPANLAFASRYGVPPAVFDEVGAADDDLTRPIAIDVGDEDHSIIGSGWFAPERSGDRSFRWAGRRAEIPLPPLPAGRIHVRLYTYAFNYPGAPDQRLQVQIEDATGGPVVVGPDWAWVEVEIDLRRRTTPSTPMMLLFSRATPPSAVQASQDGRQLSAAVDRVEITPGR